MTEQTPKMLILKKKWVVLSKEKAGLGFHQNNENFSLVRKHQVKDGGQYVPQSFWEGMERSENNNKKKLTIKEEPGA